MTTRSSPRPLFLDTAADPIFGMFHPATGPVASSTAVLLCPPWGWDEISSYRSRRDWADALAADGHPTLRIDLPSSGDSVGTPLDADRVTACSEAIDAAARWLIALPGIRRVATIGLGLGGLVTAQAIADGAPIDDLVLWGTPTRGRAFVREQRAFAAMQSSRLGATEGSAAELAPDDGLEVGGFVLSADTLAALTALDLTTLPLGRLQRALLLERDGAPGQADVARHLAELGVDVGTAGAKGWTEMVFHPEQYDPPVAVFRDVVTWLAAGPTAGSATVGEAAPPAHDRIEFEHEGVRIRESPTWIGQPTGDLFGILSEPVDLPATTLCAVFLNAGAVRRIGPNRLWVEASRHWSAAGVPTIRMDMEGIGDADGDATRYLDVGNFYTAEFGAQVGAILDHLEALGYGPRFVLIGLCAGAYWAFHTAAADPRVVSASVINPRAMVWDADLLTRREAQKVERLLEPAIWHRLVRGEIRPSRIVAISRAVARRGLTSGAHAIGRWRTARRSATTEDPTEVRLDALLDLGTRVVIAFSADEPVHDELEADGIFARLDRWPNVVVTTLPGHDHTLRPIDAQQALRDLLDGELELVLGGRRDPALT